MSRVQLVEFKTRDGGVVYVETVLPEENQVDDHQADEWCNAGSTRENLRGAIDTTKVTIEEALGKIAPIADSISSVTEKFTFKPDEVEISFNVKLGAEAKIILTTLSGEANLGVRMLWKNSQQGEKGGA
ncbi:MAG: hypothetical protein LBI62_06040 [Candidatus Accumulibacter sp.]|jgi:hypothetical protein|nr:hypothetical protein [Accumulibacter sp.]